MTAAKKVLLIIDNAGDFISLFKRVIEREGLDRDFTCVDVIPSSAHLLEDCLQKTTKILADSEEIGAVLVDIVLDEEIKPAESKSEAIDKSGLLVAAELRKRLPNTPILGMTQWSKVQSLLTDVTLDENLDGLLLKKIMTSDGFSRKKFHEYLEKATIKSSKRPTINIGDSASLVQDGTTDAPAPAQRLSALTFSTDAITTYQVKEIGIGNLDRILRKAFGDAEGTVRYFVPGFSGAKIFEVEGRINQTGKSQAGVTSWILKVSREEEKLREELIKHNKLKDRGLAKDFYPTLLKEALISEGPWHALATQKASNAQPLRSYINSGAPPSDFKKLLDDGIGTFVKQLYGSPYRIQRIVWQNFYGLGTKETAAILALLDERADTFRSRSGVPMDGLIERVERFITSGGSSERKLHELRRDVDTRYIHGDFHARNILVDPATLKVTTIDFPNTGQDHAVKDFAKLETDLIFSVMDSNEGADTDWQSISGWQSILESLEWVDDFFSRGMPAASATSDFLSMINALRSCTIAQLPTTTKEEYLLSLLSYTLKLLPYPDISLPKKAFALQYANKIFEQI